MRFCPLCSGSSGNSTYIEAGNIRILIDAGLSCKRITALMNEIGADPAQLTAILVTHEHSDHIKGIEILSSKYSVPVYANRECWSAMRNQMARVKPSEICVFESDKTFYIGGVEVFPFTTYHDSPLGLSSVIKSIKSRSVRILAISIKEFWKFCQAVSSFFWKQIMMLIC